MKIKIERSIDINEIRTRIENFKVTAILGPRQSGKTTIAKEFNSNEYFDLENPQDLQRLDNPQTAATAVPPPSSSLSKRPPT